MTENGSSERFRALDGVRGYAAFVVLVYHAILGMDPTLILRVLNTTVWTVGSGDLWPKLWLSVFHGESAVLMFFLLSGCVLTLSLQRDFARYGTWRTAAAFVVRRVFRIYPASITCVVAAALSMYLMARVFPESITSFSTTDILRNVALVDPVIIGATWTLTVELLVIPALLIAASLHRRIGLAGLVLFLVYGIVARRENALVFHHAQVGLFLLHFAFGACVGTGFGRLAARICRLIGWLPLLLAFLFVRQLLPYSLLIIIAQAWLGFAFLSLLLHDNRASQTKVFTSPFAAFLGAISFGFYLWNVPLLNLAFAWRFAFPPFMAAHPVELGLLLTVLITPMTVLLSVWSLRFIEEPCIRAGALLSKRIRGVRRSATPNGHAGALQPGE